MRNCMDCDEEGMGAFYCIPCRKWLCGECLGDDHMDCAEYYEGSA